jgi:hypothetical protein
MGETKTLSALIYRGPAVEYTTALADLYFLGVATPRYLFIDTNAPAIPQRYYRLRWP